MREMRRKRVGEKVNDLAHENANPTTASGPIAMPSLFYLPKVVGLPGSKLTFTQTNTTTPQDVYTDEDLSVAHEVPVEADAAGVFPPIYLDPTLPDYRVKYTTSADVLIYQVDDYPSNQNVQQSMRLESTNPFLFLYDTDGTSGFRKYRVRAAGAAFEIQQSNEAESVFTPIIRHEGGILFSGSTEVAVTAGGTFTGNLSGMSGTASGTFNYRRVNNIVHVWLVTGVTGTSDETTMDMTSSDIPASIIPASSKVCPCVVIDNGNSLMSAIALIDTGGTIRFDIAKSDAIANYVQFKSNGFTASGTKGIAGGWSISYPLL